MNINIEADTLRESFLNNEVYKKYGDLLLYDILVSNGLHFSDSRYQLNDDYCLVIYIDLNILELMLHLCGPHEEASSDTYVYGGNCDSIFDGLKSILKYVLHGDELIYEETNPSIFYNKDFKPRLIMSMCRRVLTNKLHDEILLEINIDKSGRFSTIRDINDDNVIAINVINKSGLPFDKTKLYEYLNRFKNIKIINIEGTEYAHSDNIEVDFIKLCLPNRTKSAANI